MESLTGVPAFDWALALLYAVATTLVVGSFLWRSAGSRVGGALVVPLVVGLTGISFLVVLFSAESRGLEQVSQSVAGWGFAVVVLMLGIVIADSLVARVSHGVGSALHLRADRRAGDVALALTLSSAGALGLVGIVQLDGRTASSQELSETVTSGRARVLSEYELPGQPMDIAFRSASEGYLSFADGRIARFAVPAPGAELELTVVATGLDSPRGIAVVGGALIVAELGALPCDPPFPCKGEHVGASSVEEGERRILRESAARLLRFEIAADGTLTNPQAILDELPVANTDHGVNAVTAGIDGRVYVSVGHLDRLVLSSLTDAERERPNGELLGTVLSVRPDGTDARIFARGLRNVYDLAFDDVGRLYGVDNSGKTRRGWRREEALAIREGADYGYPFDGTFAPYTRRTDPPLVTLDTAGSAGVEWVRWRGHSTLVVGSCNDVYAISLSVVDADVTAPTHDAVQHLMRVPGCVTGIERIIDGRLAMTLFTFGGPPRLYLVELES